MSMGNVSPSINLLKKEEQSFLDKFIHWSLTVGRYVVILTETIALSAFLYRFTLDRQLIDLHDSIKQKQAVINLLKNNEETYRGVQDRITIASTLSTNGAQTIGLINDILNFVPPEMIINNINFTGERVRIQARVQSVGSLSNFIKKLREYEPITSVSLDHLENKPSSATIVVNITTVIKKKGGSNL